MAREVMISDSILRNRDGVKHANVGDKRQMVETEKGLRSFDPRDRNAKLVDMRVTEVRHSTRIDKQTGKTVEVQHITLREEG